METRVHKLLVSVGEEGVELEARDFEKLSEVIVNQYLPQANPTFRNFLVEMITKVVRRIPLKSHLYAGLTVTIAKGYPELAGKILQSIVGTLQTDLSIGKFTETLNSLNYLSETMNVSFLNSLNYMNLLEDLLQAAEKQPDISLKKSLICLLIKALPLYGYSLYEKTLHEFKKFMEKLSKLAEGDQLFSFLYHKFTQAQLNNYSAMNRLGADFTGAQQHNGKLRLLIDLKGARGKDIYNYDLYKWDTHSNDLEYEAFRKGEGLVLRVLIEELIDTFSGNAEVLWRKFYNIVKNKCENLFTVRFIVECLILRGLRSKNCMTEYFLLSNLKNNPELSSYFSKTIEEFLFEFFNSAETFELSLLVSFAKLFSFVCTNSKEEIDWNRYTDEEDSFLKRAALLRLILQKMTLLNDKFKCPQALLSFENNKPFTSEEEFSSNDKEVFDNFDKAIKQKTESAIIATMITKQRDYEVFLEALFRRTALSETHLKILSQRYTQILSQYHQWDWALINKIRNFFRNSFFHRLFYLRFMINRKFLSFPSYINYLGQLKNKSEIQMIWIKMQLNELNGQFGKSLKSTK